MCYPYDLDESISYEKALDLPYSDKWMVVMRDEMSSMESNQVWELLIFHLGANLFETNRF